MSIANKFNIPPALFETIRRMNAEGTEYQEKVKALMAKRGIKSLADLSPEEKKDFFNTLDSMHKAKNEEVELDEAINHLQMAKHHQALAKEHDRISDAANRRDEPELSDAHGYQSDDHQNAAKAHLQAHKTGNPKDVAAAKKATRRSLQTGSTPGGSIYRVGKYGDDSHKDYNYSKLRSGADAVKKGLKEEVELDEAKKSVSKDDVTKLLIKYGNNPQSAKKMVDKEFASAVKSYPDASASKIAEVIRSVAEEVEELDELSKKTLSSYIDKADDSVRKLARTSLVGANPKQKESIRAKIDKRIDKRLDAMTNAVKKMVNKNEEVDLEESKSSTGYDLYHKDFSSAMQHAYDFAKKKYGIEVDPNEIDRNVAMGPRKPASGKANAYRLLDKTGKKAIQVQVANLDNKRYELNMYKEEVELDEVLDTPSKTLGYLAKATVSGLKSGALGTGKFRKRQSGIQAAVRKAKEKIANEEVELTESHFKVGQRVKCIASGMKGTVTKVDPEEKGKYYTVKQDSGKVMKYAPDELKAL